MEKGDPTYDEMMCFYKGELKEWAVTTSTKNDQQLVLNRTNTMAFYENSERKVEALFKNLPNIAHETAKVSTYYISGSSKAPLVENVLLCRYCTKCLFTKISQRNCDLFSEFGGKDIGHAD